MAFECPPQAVGLSPAAFIDPCLPTRVEKAPTAEGWVHEIKHDGFRLQIHARKDRVLTNSAKLVNMAWSITFRII